MKYLVSPHYIFFFLKSDRQISRYKTRSTENLSTSNQYLHLRSCCSCYSIDNAVANQYFNCSSIDPVSWWTPSFTMSIDSTDDDDANKSSLFTTTLSCFYHAYCCCCVIPPLSSSDADEQSVRSSQFDQEQSINWRQSVLSMSSTVNVQHICELHANDQFQWEPNHLHTLLSEFSRNN